MIRVIEWIDRLLLAFVEFAERESSDIWDSETDNLW